MLSTRANLLLLAGVYLLAMLWVWAGTTHAREFADIHLGSFIGLAFAATLILGRLMPSKAHMAVPVSTPTTMLALAMAMAVAHWTALGGVPILQALAKSDYYEIAKLRQSISDQPAIFRYSTALLIKVVFPVLLLRFIDSRRYVLAAVTAIVGMVYGVSLLQKSYPIFVAAPALIFLAFRSLRWALAGGLVIVAAVCGMVLVANSSLRPTQLADLPAAVNAARYTIEGLSERIFLVPGKVVDDWISAFPSAIPFEKGCGYRFVSRFVGCPFTNNPILLYQHYFPDYVRQGISGSYNAAHFAEEYANFGPPGLALSSLLVVIVLAGIAYLVGSRGPVLLLATNFPFIMSLSSTALHTTLLSGGWLAMLALTWLMWPPSGEAQPELERRP